MWAGAAGSACTSTCPVDWDEIAELVEDAYRMVAPKKLIDLLDEA